jgi:hypothetical protein
MKRISGTFSLKFLLECMNTMWYISITRGHSRSKFLCECMHISKMVMWRISKRNTYSDSSLSVCIGLSCSYCVFQEKFLFEISPCVHAYDYHVNVTNLKEAFSACIYLSCSCDVYRRWLLIQNSFLRAHVCYVTYSSSYSECPLECTGHTFVMSMWLVHALKEEFVHNTRRSRINFKQKGSHNAYICVPFCFKLILDLHCSDYPSLQNLHLCHFLWLICIVT